MDRYNALDKLGIKFKPINILKPINNVIDVQDSNISSPDQSDSNKDNILNFNITLSKEEWNSIKEPTETLYHRTIWMVSIILCLIRVHFIQYSN